MDPTRDYRDRLKKAVDSEPVPPFLEARLNNAIRAHERRTSMLRWAAVSVAALVLAAGGYFWNEMRVQDSYIASLTDRLGHLLGLGLGDHVHCSVFRTYPDPLRADAEVARDIPAEYRAIVPIVRRHVPSRYRLTLAHECSYQGRDFVHVSLKDGESLVSLVIAQREDGEAFDAPNVLNEGSTERFVTAAFESGSYLVYFVSDLPQEENTRLMAEMAPQLEAALAAI